MGSRFDFSFSNLLGSCYSGGTVVFTPDGNSLLSPVGNRVTLFDLVANKAVTLPFENKHDIKHLAISPNGRSLLSIDIEGKALLCNLHKRVQVCTFSFKKTLSHVAFSPDNKYISVCFGRKVQLWHAPPLITQFRPFVLLREFTGHYDDITHLEWFPDATGFVTSSKDNTIRCYTTHPTKGYVPMSLTGHKDYVVAAYFGGKDDDDKRDLYTFSRDGAVFVWAFQYFDDISSDESMDEDEDDYELSSSSNSSNSSSENEDSSDDGRKFQGEKTTTTTTTTTTTHKKHVLLKRKRRVLEAESENATCMFAKGTYRIKEKFYCEQKDYAQVSTVNVYRGRKKDVNIAVIGFSSGFFGLYEMPGFNLVHNLSISSTSITGAAINSTGQWLALGASDLGQLLVWEWESETYIIKQQGHFFDVNDCVFSPDGQILASASDEGKVKLWNCDTGFCFITFADHSAPVTALEFSSNGQILFSASLDGTVRAYDLVRYRNFRTFTANTPVQFTCLAIEPSGEVVVAGALEPFNIYVWSLRTGKLIDVMAGHEAPLSGLTFTPVTSLLASSAWDGNVMIWDLFTGKGQVEVLGGENPHDLLALDFRPDGKELCTSCMDGNLYFWDPFNAVLKFTINGRRDMRAGRRANQARSAANSTQSLAFTSVCYSADGDYILAGGNSKFICIYHVKHKILVKKFALSENYSYDGMKEKLNSRYLTDSGATKQALDMNDSDEEDDMIDTRYTPNQQSISLPGVRRGDKSSRRTTGPVMRSKAVCFSPSGQQWAAATTEGVVVYALGQTNTFDPLELDLDITPENCLKALSSREFSSALTMALCLNDMKLIRKCVEKTPVVSVELVLQNVPETRLKPLLSMLSQGITASPHLHFYLIWMKHLLLYHGKYLSSNVQTFSSSLRTFQKALISGRKDLSVICEQNTFQLDYLCKAVQLKKNNIPVAAADDAALEAEEEA